jgi:hypothetical protein
LAGGIDMGCLLSPGLPDTSMVHKTTAPLWMIFGILVAGGVRDNNADNGSVSAKVGATMGQCARPG